MSSSAPFSGKVDFIETEMYWPTTHMVAAKDKALGCTDCHAKGGRLEGIEGVYLPGRGDVHPWITQGGWILALLTLLGVLGHGGIRILAAKKD